MTKSNQSQNSVSPKFKLAILGCGFVSDSYTNTLEHYPAISLEGVCDLNKDRAEKLAQRVNTKAYTSLAKLLDDPTIEGIINLTNPRDHYSTTRQCLEAGKHVYVEKPLGMNLDEANGLVELARSRKLNLSVAPCSVLSPTAQTLWKAIRDGKIGKVHLVYANFEDGMIAPQQEPWTWLNSCGAPWPAKDEFEVGCTFEHAGYFLTWLISFFGSVKRATTFASVQIPKKGIEVDGMAPDFTCGCLQFDNDIVARVTCGLVAPRDKSLVIIGDQGTLRVDNLRDDYGKVLYTPYTSSGKKAIFERYLNGLRRRIGKYFPDSLITRFELSHSSLLNLDEGQRTVQYSGDKRADFLRGPMEWIDAIREERASRLPGELGTHMVEIINELQCPSASMVKMKTSVPKLQPLKP